MIPPLTREQEQLLIELVEYAVDEREYQLKETDWLMDGAEAEADATEYLARATALRDALVTEHQQPSSPTLTLTEEQLQVGRALVAETFAAIPPHADLDQHYERPYFWTRCRCGLEFAGTDPDEADWRCMNHVGLMDPADGDDMDTIDLPTRRWDTPTGEGDTLTS